MLTKLKNNIYNILLTIMIGFLYIVPMGRIDYTSYLSHDARWWLNQYYEYYHTFGHASPVAFYGFNKAGSVINIAYPQAILKILETPLVMLHMQDPYIVIGVLTMMIVASFIGLIYIINKKMRLPDPYLTSLLMTSVLVLTGRGVVNSLPQLLATSFILIGVIAIIDDTKWYLMTVSVAGMLMTSLTTSIVGALTLIIIFFTTPSWSRFKKLMLSGIVGLGIGLLTVIPILHLSKIVNMPYTGGMQFKLATFILTSLNPQDYIFITVALFIFIIPLASKQNYKLNKTLGVIIMIYLVLSLFPQFTNDIIMAPLQKGTFQRIWTLFAIIAICWITPVINSKHKHLIALLTTCVLSTSYATYIYYPISTAAQTPFVKAYHHKDWDKAYAIVDSEIYLRDKKTGQLLLKPELSETALFSPDYTPKNATKKTLEKVFMSPDTIHKRDGVKKVTIDGNTLKVIVNPKQKITPLVVWHYDFLHYKIDGPTKNLTVKDGMYYYKGKTPATITITVTK